MHPPFVFTDHKVSPSTHPARPHVRRTRPARLDLAPAPGWPPVPLVAPPVPLAPAGVPLIRGGHLRVVPPPRNGWRDVLGRWMIRTGQRMILTRGPG